MNKIPVFDSSKESPYKYDTIAAISTPFGESGIGIVRVSGPLSEQIAKRIFRHKKGQKEFVSHHFYYGEIIDPDNNHFVDEVLLVFMKAPKTYTREDILEIHCHGGYIVLEKVLELVLKEGARLAEPGEFTKRAFLNGRIDLTQAEAVIDIIRAKTISSLEIATQQLRGRLYNELISLKEILLKHLALIEAHIDFPEEDIDPLHLEEVKRDFSEIIKKLEEWVSTYKEGKIFREGVTCAIIGKTNVGKSSLLNVLLKEDRAIVTPIPGTTRDIIEEVLNIYGIPIRLIDTAGLRKAKDFIEEEGIKRAKQKVTEADLILLIIDGSREIDQDDLEIFKEIESKKKILVLNKIDLPLKIQIDQLKKEFQTDPIVSISALKSQGIEDLKKTIYKFLLGKDIRITPDHLIVSNIRHKIALEKTKESLKNALSGINKKLSIEFIAFEIRQALDSMAEMVGETTSEDILNRIFEQFCIGK